MKGSNHIHIHVLAPYYIKTGALLRVGSMHVHVHTCIYSCTQCSASELKPLLYSLYSSWRYQSHIVIMSIEEVGSESQSHSTGPTLGVHYYVLRADDSWNVAEIIQKRENPENQRTEFYVHYKECESLLFTCTCILIVPFPTYMYSPIPHYKSDTLSLLIEECIDRG